jgi:hypothetical protein
MDYITENWQRFLREEKKESTKKKERDEKRKKAAGMGMLDAFSDDEKDLLNTNALYEDELEEADKKKPGCIDPGNPWHNDQGELTDPDADKTGSWSCPTKGKTSRQGRSKRWTKLPCGRAGKFRCKDGSAKWEEGQDPSPAELEDDDHGDRDADHPGYDLIDKESLRRLIHDELQEVLVAYEDYLDDQENLIDEGNEKVMLKWCRQRGLFSMQRFLAIQNQFELSAKGDLNKKEKK